MRLAFALACVLAVSSSAQVAGLCGPGKNCRARSFTATTGSTSTPAVTIPNLDLLVLGQCYFQTNGANLISAACNNVFPGGTQALLGGGLWLANWAQPTSFTAPSGLTGAAVLAGASATGRLYLSDGNTWRDLGAGAHPVLNARTLLVDLGAGGALGWAHTAPYVGGASPTVTETCNSASVQPLSTTGDFGSFSREARECPTTAVLGNVSSVLVSETTWATSNRTRVCFRAGLVSTADVVFMAGETTAASFANPESAPNKSGMWVRFDTTVPDTNWMLCTSDGVSAATCTSSGVAATGGGLFCLDQREGSGVTLWVNGRARVRHTTNLPNAATAMAVGAALETRAASSKAFQLSRLTIEVP